MASRKLYLRPHYEVEKLPDLSYPLPPNIKDLGAIPREYKLGCSSSLAPVILQDTLGLEMVFDDESIGMRDRAVPNPSSDAMWKFSSRTIYGDYMQSFAPAADVTLVDGGHEGYEPHHMGNLVLSVLRENNILHGLYNLQRHNSLYFMDFITGQQHQLA